MFKNRKSIFFSYDIYGFTLNRIYKKTLRYVYLGFSVGIKVVKKLFFVGEKKAVASDSRKKTVCNAIIVAASLQQKDVVREVLLDLVGINFRNCRTTIDPGHHRADTGDVFDVGNVPFEQSPSDTELPPER